MQTAKHIMAEIRQWHEADRRTQIERTFSLGDLILKAVIHTGLTEWDIITRIREDLGELALAPTSYQRAARLARVFTRRQRKVLIAKAVSIQRAEILAGQMYEGRKRVQIINRIKVGKITSPWRAIQGNGKRAHANSDYSLPEDSRNNPDVVVVAHDGEIEEDAVVNVLKNLIRRCGAELASRLWTIAYREACKR